MFIQVRRFTLLVVVTFMLGCGKDKAVDRELGASHISRVAGAANTARIIAAAQEPKMWLTYGGSHDEHRHSALAQINRDTLSDLRVGWVYERAKPRGAEATPLVIDEVMYVTGSWSIVYARDARTGQELWVYDPKVSG